MTELNENSRFFLLGEKEEEILELILPVKLLRQASIDPEKNIYINLEDKKIIIGEEDNPINMIVEITD